MELESFFYYFVINKTLNLYHKKKESGVAGPICTHKNIKGPMGQ